MTRVEQAVLNAFRALPYAGFTACATCGDCAYCQGANPRARVCIVCFEFEHDCAAPIVNRQRPRRAA